MKSIIKKTGRLIKRVRVNFKSDSYFSLKYAFMHMFEDMFGSLRLRKISNRIKNKRQQWIVNYLSNHLQETNKKYKNSTNNGTYTENAPIWVCWWTGIETAPKLVQKCISSIKNNCGNHEVIFIDQNTYKSYIDVPDYIIGKVQNGQIGLAHLCDYIRISLIEKHGGLWLDATIYCSNTISEDYFNIPFFTCKSERCECGYLSEMRWVTFVLGGWKNNLFYQYIKEAFEEYWKTTPHAIDYLFFDAVIEIAYREIPYINHLIESVPINNINRDDLQAAMNKALPAEKFTEIVKESTQLYKLSWRETYSEKTSDDKESIYAFFINTL